MHFHSDQNEEAVELVKRHHYSKRPPANVQCVGTFHDDGGLFGDHGKAVAACFFSLPPTRWSEDVWELSRLVRDDVARPLSRLVSLTCNLAKRKGADLLVSFADRTHGHHGGIYQACSWNYDGARDRRVDGCIVDGTFVPGRSCNSRWGTSSPRKLAELLGRDVSSHYDEGKHLYWRALNRTGGKKAARLGLRSTAYPKPNIGEIAA